MESYIALLSRTHNKIANSCKSYVAAIAGMALGIGLETALACDIRIATENAVMGLPQITSASFPARAVPNGYRGS
jgi:enoyl-CoA hydratase